MTESETPFNYPNDSETALPINEPPPNPDIDQAKQGNDGSATPTTVACEDRRNLNRIGPNNETLNRNNLTEPIIAPPTKVVVQPFTSVVVRPYSGSILNSYPMYL